MNPTVKTVLIISLKNAVNAILTNTVLASMLPGLFNLHSSGAWWNILKIAAATVASRESMIWLPKLLKWSNTNAEN